MRFKVPESIVASSITTISVPHPSLPVCVCVCVCVYVCVCLCECVCPSVDLYVYLSGFLFIETNTETERPRPRQRLRSRHRHTARTISIANEVGKNSRLAISQRFAARFHHWTGHRQRGRQGQKDRETGTHDASKGVIQYCMAKTPYRAYGCDCYSQIRTENSQKI